MTEITFRNDVQQACIDVCHERRLRRAATWSVGDVALCINPCVPQARANDLQGYTCPIFAVAEQAKRHGERCSFNHTYRYTNQ